MRRRGQVSSRKRATAHPRLEVLEERRVLSTLTVTNNTDYLAGCLRAEISAAQPGDTIVFDPSLNGQTITLGGGQLEINKNLTIQGPGLGLLAINGGGFYNGSRVFQVDAQTNVTISGLTIEGGIGFKYGPTNNTFNFTPDYYDGYGGGILNLGTLALSGCAVTGNVASTGYVGGAFGLRHEGGGIYNHGTMTLSGCTVTGNTAADFYLGYNGIDNHGAGGGIFNDEQGHLTILSSVVQNNTASDGADVCNLGTMKISKDSQVGEVSHKL
jgi:hypothetical protein